MKKFIYLVGIILSATLLTCLQSCSSDDDSVTVPSLEKNYFTIENATFKSGSLPTPTTSDTLQGVEMSSQAMNGAMNYITVVTKQKVNKFFVGVIGVDGYYEYVPTAESAQTNAIAMRADSEGYNRYLIPVMMSDDFVDDFEFTLNAEIEDFYITVPIVSRVSYIETQPGAIEVKLAFSNDKDIDLHMYTPSNEHIYYGNKGGTYTLDDGSKISYGLDIDSNAGCYIDGINKENIYIPEELVEDGEYRIEVNMYSNCVRTIPTNWSIVARYQGHIINPTSGVNPASDVYPINASNSDHTEVMRFTVRRSSNSPAKLLKRAKKFTAAKVSEYELIKIEEDSFNK